MTDLSWMNVPGPNGLTWAQENAMIDLSWMNVPGPDGRTWAQNYHAQEAAKRAGTGKQQDAMGQLRVWLKDYGIGDLAEPLWQYILDTNLSSEDEAWLWIQEQPTFQKRFPAFKDLQQQNRSISAKEYIELERNYVEVMRQANLPTQFFDKPDDFTDLIKNNVSASEFQDRIQKGYQRVAQAAPEVRAAFKQYFGIQGDNALAAFFIDPERSAPALMKAAAVAEIGAAGIQSNASVDLNYATKLSNMGINYTDALSGFKKMQQQRSLFATGINESAITSGGISESTLPADLKGNNSFAPRIQGDTNLNTSNADALGMDYVFGTNVEVQRELQMRLAKRTALTSGANKQITANREGQTSLSSAD